MSKRLVEKMFSKIGRIIFEEIGPKLQTGMLKIFMDELFVVFEKTAHNFDIIAYNYLRLYEEIVEKELEMSCVSPDDLVLVIGCGSLPSTSAQIAMKTDAVVVAIDNDKKAVEDAKKFLARLNLENSMTLENVDGRCYPVEKFDVIFVLYGVKQQKEVLTYLSDKIKDNARVVFRTTPDQQGRIRGEQVDLSNLFVVKNCIRNTSLGPLDSFLLCKKTRS